MNNLEGSYRELISFYYNISHELMCDKKLTIVMNFSFFLFSFPIGAPLDCNFYLVLTGKTILIFILFDLHTLHHHTFSTPDLPASFNRYGTQLTYFGSSVHKLHETNVALQILMWLTQPNQAVRCGWYMQTKNWTLQSSNESSCGAYFCVCVVNLPHARNMNINNLHAAVHSFPE